MSYYECKYCLKKYIRERFFKEHECEEMKRYKLLKTSRGLASYDAFCVWCKCKGYRPPTHDRFVDSRLFKSFFNFIAFANKIALPGRNTFIKLMADIDIYPKDWTQDIVYQHYIEEFDNLFSPIEQAEISVDTVFELSRIFECETGEIFLYLDGNTLINIIRAKKLSPWFLLFSKKFKWFRTEELTREQKIILSNYLDPKIWDRRFAKSSENVKRMKMYVNALEL